MEEKIKKIVYEEFQKLLSNIKNDFSTNYIKKNYNFLLSQLDENLTANMVFVSSFESKSGNAIEACAKRIARLKYGDDNVPSIVNPKGLSHNIPAPASGQIIISNVNLESGDLHGEISAFRGNNIASGQGTNRQESTLTQEKKKDLLQIAPKYITNNIYTKPVDLAFFDGTNWNILELKAGGDLDSSNAPSNIEKLLLIYTGLNIPNANIYFGTLYNKDGEGNTWKGIVKKHIAYPEMFLIGSQFWNKILPEPITYEKFTQLYKEALEELDLNNQIKTMIEDTIR